MADLVCLGELLIDFVPTVSGHRLRHVPTFEKAAGGAPANVAVGFSRLGGHSRFIGKVGQDEFGHFLEETLQRENVDTSGLLKTAEAMTTLAFVSLRADGERDFMFYRRPGADTLLHADEVDHTAINGASMFHFGSISLIAEPSRTATFQLANLAAAEGKLVSFDPNLRPPLWPSLDEAKERILQGMQYATVAKLAEDELAFLVGEGTTAAQACVLFTQYPQLRLIAVTRGPEGCVLCLRDRTVEVSGLEVAAVDTTGAGDGFTAALLYRLNERMSVSPDGSVDWNAPDTMWQAVGRFANAAGALVVTRRGGIPSMPRFDEVHRLMCK